MFENSALLPGTGELSLKNAMYFVKATDKHMRGHGDFMFDLGKIYCHPGQVKCCHEGFHCCDTLGNITRTSLYDNDGHNRYFIVRAWGEYEATDTGFERKYAFECMCLLTELHYTTLEEIQQSRAAIAAAFQGEQQKKNLDDFDDLQAQFPSVLKKRVKKLRTKTVVLEDANRCAIRKTAQMKPRRYTYRSCPWIFSQDIHKYHFTGSETDGKFDIYHCDHEPAMGIRGLKAARDYVSSLV